MSRTHPRTRAIIGLALWALCVSASRAEGPASDVYGHTLKGTALIVTPTCTGTGWVIDADRGLMITNEHVVGRQEQHQGFTILPVNSDLLDPRV